MTLDSIMDGGSGKFGRQGHDIVEAEAETSSSLMV